MKIKKGAIPFGSRLQLAGRCPACQGFLHPRAEIVTALNMGKKFRLSRDEYVLVSDGVRELFPQIAQFLGLENALGPFQNLDTF